MRSGRCFGRVQVSAFQIPRGSLRTVAVSVTNWPAGALCRDLFRVAVRIERRERCVNVAVTRNSISHAPGDDRHFTVTELDADGLKRPALVGFAARQQGRRVFILECDTAGRKPRRRDRADSIGKGCAPRGIDRATCRNLTVGERRPAAHFFEMQTLSTLKKVLTRP